MAQLVKRLPLVHIMISQLVGLSPALSSVLTAQPLEPASDSASPSLSAPLQLVLSFSQKLTNVEVFFVFFLLSKSSPGAHQWCATPDFSSGRDLPFRGFEPRIGSLRC